MYPTFRQTFVYKMYTKCLYAKCVPHFDKLLYKFCHKKCSGHVYKMYTKFVDMWYTFCLHFCLHFVYISCIYLVQPMHTKCKHSFRVGKF